MKQKAVPEALYFNREWSWLAFNRRVLHEAEEENPLLERLKFTAIVSSNLEEFFMVRVAAIKKERAIDAEGSSVDLQDAATQLAGIGERVRALLHDQYENFNKRLLPLLEQQGIRLITSLETLVPWRENLEQVFVNEIEPVLTPLSVGPTHPFPNLNSGRLYLAVGLAPLPGREDVIEQCELSFLNIPTHVEGRFLEIESGVFTPIELVIRLFLERLYNGFTVRGAGIVKVTRDADFVIDDEDVRDLLAEIESKIKRMHHRDVVKIEHEKGIDPDLLERLVDNCAVGPEDVYQVDGPLNLKDLFELYGRLARPDLKDAPFVPIRPAVFGERDMFSLIADGDVLLNHPYHDYEPVIRLLEQAAGDKRVLAIKQTLYRTSPDSAVIRALVRAAEAGKHVSVVVELKARFDEQRNISWARKLVDAGVHVIYGIAGLKTHAKLLLIVRREPQGIRRYLHLATGNYNETTARLYTDCSLFTADEHLGADVSQLCNMLTGFSYPSGWNYLTIAPLDLRNRLLALIGRETENARRGMKARIVGMMNALTDPGIIDALYEASRAGVRVQLLVRGMCMLIPGKPGTSETISVTSIVGRFLQHSRIYCFHNSGEEEYYLSSADWMVRNLDRRVELLFPVRRPSLCAVLARLLKLQFEDTVNAWQLLPDGSYERIKGKKQHDSFEETYRFFASREEEAVSESGEAVIFQPIRAPRD